MKSLPRWTSSSAFAAVLLLGASGAPALTDTNAELKATAADRADRVIVVGKAARPAQTVWVPATAKALDRFSPVFADDRAVARDTLLAQADAKKKAAAR